MAEIRRFPGAHRVFNLEVEGDHEYFAGEGQVLSHNSGTIGCPKFPNPGPGEPFHVGSFDASAKQLVDYNRGSRAGFPDDFTTAHHIPQAAALRDYQITPPPGGKVTRGKGVTINLPKWIHEKTRSMRKYPDLGSLKDNIDADIANLRTIMNDAKMDADFIDDCCDRIIEGNRVLGLYP